MRVAPTVGLETSKSLPTHLRVYYHLQLIEAYLEELGLEFERSFALTPDAVRDTVDANVRVTFYDRRLFLELADARRSLGYVPMNTGSEDGIEIRRGDIASRFSVDQGGRVFRVERFAGMVLVRFVDGETTASRSRPRGPIS